MPAKIITRSTGTVIRTAKKPPAKPAAAPRTGPRTRRAVSDDTTLRDKDRIVLARIQRNGWTLDTVPTDALYRIVKTVSVAVTAQLFGATPADVSAKVGRTAPARVRTPRPVSTDATTTAPRARRTPTAAPAAPRTLTDDMPHAVPLRDLPVGARFKTPDSPTEGFRGWTGRIERQGAGSVSVSGCAFDTLAPGTLVVHLSEAVAT